MGPVCSSGLLLVRPGLYQCHPSTTQVPHQEPGRTWFHCGKNKRGINESHSRNRLYRHFVFIVGVPQEVLPSFSLLIVDVCPSTSHAQSLRPARQRTAPEYLHASRPEPHPFGIYTNHPYAGADEEQSPVPYCFTFVEFFKLINVTRTSSPPRYSYELLTSTQELPSSSARSRHFRHHSRSSGCCLPACLLACLLLARSLHATITHFTRIIKPVSKYLLGLPTYPLGCISVHSFQHRILEARVEDTQFANVTGKSATFETGRWKNWKRAGTSSTTPELDEGGGESKL